ncbi:chemotaxis protein CheB [Burkholderia gladioli]|uniref:chemotaxis protein CheB n=1 Tax=Burkholderia gladioli TaxID=28095 RepID=UPI001640E279|nr:chemotaxis protein CheB [Burkholderia gladioli]MDN7495101.1 chemotaxis protein CheB [Burkholderia gladioli]
MSLPALSPPGALSAPARPPYEAVAIGASAGGIEVLAILLGALPAAFPAIVMVVVHLPTDAPSHLAQALARYCLLPVQEPDAGEPLAAGHVYVAPPDYHLLVADDLTVALSVDARVAFSRPSIDVLFESAAHCFRRRLLGVLLSGANDDGAAGLARIRAAGGTAWVQDPATAEASAMPLAAIARGAADEILSPLTMAGRLAAFSAYS